MRAHACAGVMSLEKAGPIAGRAGSVGMSLPLFCMYMCGCCELAHDARSCACRRFHVHKQRLWICRQALTGGWGAVLEGQDFRERVVKPGGSIDLEAFSQLWPSLRVMARCTPSDKLTIVKGAPAACVGWVTPNLAPVHG